MKPAEISISDYLKLIDPERRDYAERYLQWRRNGSKGHQPVPPKMPPQSARLLRHRLDQMLQGKPMFCVTKWHDRSLFWQRAEW